MASVVLSPPVDDFIKKLPLINALINEEADVTALISHLLTGLSEAAAGRIMNQAAAARLVNQTHLADIPDRAQVVLGRMFASVEGSVITRMLTDLQRWSNPGNPKMKPMKPELVDFLQLVEFLEKLESCCLAGGYVAGSAAVYMELALQSPTPLGWWPNDIDCFVDSTAAGARVLAALAPLGTLIKFSDANGDLEFEFDGTWPAPAVKTNTRYEGTFSYVGGFYPGGSMVCTLPRGTGPQVQVVCQVSTVDTVCGCARATDTACGVCLKRDSGVDASNENIWPRGHPAHRFDLDVPGVMITGPLPGQTCLQVVRAFGNPVSNTIRVRPHALWTLTETGPRGSKRKHLDLVHRRLQKYARRGWHVQDIPDTCTINGVAMITPPATKQFLLTGRWKAPEAPEAFTT